jgi:electron transfer flavoprotein beta subunit
LGVDLILMGKQATDTDRGQVPPMLAQRLGWPQATFAARIHFDANALTVIRETDHGEEEVILSLPAVISADLRLNEPRYIALPGIIKARSKPLEHVQPLTELRSRAVSRRISAVPARAPGRLVDSVDELADALREHLVR